MEPDTGPSAPDTGPSAPEAGRTGEQRLFIHLGEPKTGTTFLQDVLRTNRGRLAAAGVVFPGAKPVEQWRASQDVLQVVQKPGDPAPDFTGAWARVVGTALRSGRTGLISHELLSYATADQARRALSAVDRAEVHLVLTVRDPASLLPAEWQETVKHRSTKRWEQWLHDVTVDDALGQRSGLYWQAHSTMRILANWRGADIPPDRVHVVIMPSRTAGTGSLWERFASVIGVDPQLVDTSLATPNASLGVAEAEFIRRLNEDLDPEYPNWSYQWFVKDTVANGAFARRPSSARIGLPAAAHEFAAHEAQALIGELAGSGYDIVGDLAELEPARRTGAPSPAAPASPTSAAPEEMLAAAVAAMTGVLQRLERMRVHLEEMRGDLARARTPAPPPHGPVKAMLIGLSQEHPTMHRARVAYWRAANAVKGARSRRG